MRRAQILFLALVLASGFHEPSSAENGPAGQLSAPAIYCAEPSFDFGTVPSSTTIVHTFVITNRGTAGLAILKIRKGCGCSQADISRTTLPPGSSADLHTTHDLRSRLGKQHLTVYLHSNDPTMPYYALTCVGTVTNATPALPAQPAPLPAPAAAARPVRVEFFFEPGCVNCERVRREVLPRLEEQCRGLYVIEHRDIGVLSNYLALVAWQEQLGRAGDNEDVSMVVDGRFLLAGYAAIARDLPDIVTQAHASRDEVTPESPTEPRQLLRTRLNNFRVPGILAAGLIDGINPCAMGTLVFLLSMMTALRLRGRILLAAGIVYCITSFAAYFAIGFGLLRAFHLFWGFPGLRVGLEAVAVAALAILAALSFLDALRYHRQGRPDAVTVKLPSRVMALTHTLVRRSLQARLLLPAVFLLGGLTTLLESLCTGQVYVPTLVYLTRLGESTGRSLFLLVLYNLTFIAPLVAAFVLTYRGMQTQALLRWSRSNVVPAKILTGLLFLILAALIALL